MRFRTYHIVAAAMIIFSVAFAACSDDNNDDIGPEDEFPPIAELPTEDQMLVLSDVPTVIIGNEFDPVTAAFIRRLSDIQPSINEDTRAVVVDGVLIPNLTKEQKEGIKHVYDIGGCIILSEADPFAAYNFSMNLGEEPSFIPEKETGHDTGHFCDIYVFNSHNDELIMADVHGHSGNGNESGDSYSDDSDYASYVSGETRLDQLTPYLYGQRADIVASWVNENSLPHGAKHRRSVSDMASAQRVTFNFYPEHNHSKASGKVGSYTVVYSIYSLYSFNQKSDYYAIHEEIIGSNSAMNVGNFKDGKNYCYGFYLSEMTNDHWLYNASSESLPLGTVIQNTAPATTENARQQTVGMSFNLGGEVGVGSGGVSGGLSAGFSYSESYTVNIPDVSIKNQCMSDAENQRNARWLYTVADPTPKTNFWGYIKGFNDAPSVSINTIDVHNTWLWVVPNPTGTYRMKCLNKIEYGYYRGWNNAFTTHTRYNGRWSSYTRWINLNSPKRNR